MENQPFTGIGIQYCAIFSLQLFYKTFLVTKNINNLLNLFLIEETDNPHFYDRFIIVMTSLIYLCMDHRFMCYFPYIDNQVALKIT